jgi:hypothetical protein
MKLSKALKEKNKLTNELKALYQILQNYNSIEESSTRRYSVKETVITIVSKLKELTNLKTKIHLANAPIYSKIFEMAELKGFIKQLKAMPIDEGKVSQRYGTTNEVKVVDMNVLERDTFVKQLENQIETIQEALDYYNITTDID